MLAIYHCYPQTDSISDKPYREPVLSTLTGTTQISPLPSSFPSLLLLTGLGLCKTHSVWDNGALGWLATISLVLLSFVCMTSFPPTPSLLLLLPVVDVGCATQLLPLRKDCLHSCEGTQTYHGHLNHFLMFHHASHSLHTWWKYCMITNQPGSSFIPQLSSLPSLASI